MDTVRPITIALAGNPNSGKTTLFNNLTGARQHVGNYPGVTVEKKEGSCQHKGVELKIVDLPGAYSLTAFSPEELVARRFLLESTPDVVVDILDASNLERNLYLAVQLMELNLPLVLVCNMMDVLEQRGDELDLDKLAQRLGVAVVSTVGHKRQGMEQLLDKILEVAQARSSSNSPEKRLRPIYSVEIEQAVAAIAEEVTQTKPDATASTREWAAIKLLEQDAAILDEYADSNAFRLARQQAAELANRFEEPVESLLAQQRYEFIADVCVHALRPASTRRRTHSDRIDAVVTHRLWGVPIFLAAMFVVFWATFNLGQIPSGWIADGVTRLGELVSGLWPSDSQSPLRSLLVDGLIGGVGNVIVFLPNILVLFLAIGLLEDSGYMPRAAFIMDRIMQRIGLHGKSFIPLLLGFGCSVPAIMATRTLENRRDRLTTMMVAPLMSCGARLPIYALIIPAFFPKSWQAPILWAIYLIGIVLAVLAARLLRSTVFRGESAPFVMELPPYRVPRLYDSLLNMWERSTLYLRKAGTVILAISMLLWVLTTFPREPRIIGQASATASAETNGSTARLTNSFAGRIGRFVEPVLQPMGFDWKIGTALIGAVAAKEVFVAQMGIVYSAAGAEEEQVAPLQEQLRRNYGPLVGFCIMLFCLISSPCMATIAVTRRESGSWRWAALQFSGLTALAYVITTFVFQLGRWLV